MTGNGSKAKPLRYGAPADDSISGGDSPRGAGEEEAETHDDHDAHDTHNAPDAQGGHGPDTSDEPTIVPTTWRQLLIPLIILLFVGFLVAGPVMAAFAPKPAAPQTGQEQAPAGQATSAPSEGNTTPTVGATTAPQQAATQPANSPTPGTSSGTGAPLAATQTAVAVAGEKGDVARAPVKLEFGGATFSVAQGNDLLPDWKPSQDPATATWIQGTVANHILYVPFNVQNEALFKAAKEQDPVKLTMNTGDVFNFAVKRSTRAVNGPTTSQDQFSVNAAMAQDHAGVTLFLTGDPAPDRAVVQADFTGNIQSAVPGQ